ncbi:hypothetical protein BFP72_03190 [Reichenbachiella sp. 5M10]|uniref:hypothetical protein n=1 Tax=Reichenbachiella sp. 5M10 TaxID=1889772 RepID=UPI000C148849|nr:hypothetical protein [Reichenbachiella sp. 5M10]PIB34486.1 hypothetical protein BFP72_03190 [Reichenbachiella sp. 5M10]
MEERSFKIFDPITKDKLTEHLIGRLPPNSAVLDPKSKFVKQFIDYCSIESDLEMVKRSISELGDIRIEEYEKYSKDDYEDPILLIKRSLFVSTIIGYCRCFNSSKGRLSINQDFIKRNFPNSLMNADNTIEFHNRIVEIRNNFIAHANNYHLEQVIAFIQFEYIDGQLVSRMNYAEAANYSFHEDELENFMILSSFLMKQVQNKKEKVSAKIVEEMTYDGLMKLGAETIQKSR